jgi:hypothetical protein
MAEQSIFWTTNGTGDGANPYTQSQLFRWLYRTFCGIRANSGPLRGYLDELAVVSSGPTLVAVNAGAAYVGGVPYENDDVVYLTHTTPGSGTRHDMVILRADWRAQTVRAVYVEGTTAEYPTLTQIVGDIYEIPLAYVDVSSNGSRTITDAREFCVFSLELGEENVPDGRISTNMLANDAVTEAKIADGAVNTAQLADGAVTAAKIGNGEVGTDQIADASVTAAKLVDGSGSGVDADTVDGLHASDIVVSAAVGQSNTVYDNGTWGVPVSWTDIPNMSVTINPSTNWKAFITFTYTRTSTTYGEIIHVRAVVDSTPLEEWLIGATNSYSYSFHWGATGTAGSHTIKIQAYCSANPPTVQMVNKRLNVIVTP